MVATPAGGGKLWLFGGEFSAPNQTSFHHYRDLWSFDITTHTWERFDTKVRPSARSGHRMVMWKQYIFLFGGFQDTGIRTSYLSDLWVFDTNEYRWNQIEFSEHVQKPGARSGFSFLPTTDGLILHGGYTKTYEGKRSIGIGQALSDTWYLRVPVTESGLDLKGFKWEKKKKSGYAPTPRSGCTMALWAAKSMGVLFGGVYDDDKDEETLDSVFYNELFGLNLNGTRWISLPLKRKKKAGGGRKKKQKAAEAAAQAQKDEDEDMEDAERGSDAEDEADNEPKPWEVAAQKKLEEEEDDPNDPEKSIPFARYNTMLAVQRNTLYLYGGILETGTREYTLDDFHTLQLDKLDRFNCLKECIIENDNEWQGSDSEKDDDNDSESEGEGSQDGSKSGSESDEGEARDEGPMEGVELENLQLTDAELAAAEARRAQAEAEELRKRATAFLGVSTATNRTEEDINSTPQPGETLAAFFARTKEYWTMKAFTASGETNRGKELRRDGFALAEEAYQQYQPLLEEIVRIQAQAGLDAEELRAGGRAGGAESRNRR
ncbi:Kelch repeat containing protein [Pseudohyphozyma bogoriensis]|nr:Kelch repeat containing protein [Pseudohyphozyma bogoriensis]